MRAGGLILFPDNDWSKLFISARGRRVVHGYPSRVPKLQLRENEKRGEGIPARRRMLPVNVSRVLHAYNLTRILGKLLVEVSVLYNLIGDIAR